MSAEAYVVAEESRKLGRESLAKELRAVLYSRGLWQGNDASDVIVAVAKALTEQATTIKQLRDGTRKDSATIIRLLECSTYEARPLAQVVSSIDVDGRGRVFGWYVEAGEELIGVTSTYNSLSTAAL